VINIRQLRFRYPTGTFRLRIEKLDIAQGEKVAVAGPSGSGKTTLLNLIAGIVLPDSGCITTGETRITDLDERARREFRVCRIGMVFQEFELLEYLNVLDNILLPYRISPALTLDQSVRERARELAVDVGIEDKLRRLPRQLSQGERQRVAVCRAMLTRPRLLLADEPTGNLDMDNKDRVLDILEEQATAAGATLITVTHDRDLLHRFSRVIDFADLRETGA